MSDLSPATLRALAVKYERLSDSAAQAARSNGAQGYMDVASKWSAEEREYAAIARGLRLLADKEERERKKWPCPCCGSYGPNHFRSDCEGSKCICNTEEK
jgi:hypothetical protein